MMENSKKSTGAHEAVTAKLKRLRASGRLLDQELNTGVKVLPQMPIGIDLFMDAPVLQAEILPARTDVVFRQFYIDTNDSDWEILNSGLRANVALLRDEFFAVSTPAEALSFLDVWPHMQEQPELLSEPPRENFSWLEFQDWQRFFRLVIEGTAWNNQPEVDAFLHRKIYKDEVRLTDRELNTVVRGQPEFRISTESVGGRSLLRIHAHCVSSLEAIAASIFVDKLASVEHQTCRQCGKIFDRFEKTKHKRLFCKPACAKKFHKRRKP